MSEKRFTGKILVATNGEEFGFTIYDENKRMSIGEVVDLLNEQQAAIEEQNKEIEESSAFIIEQRIENKKLKEENEQLQAQLREKEQDERLYANEIVKLNKEAKEVLDFKSLGGDY